MLFWYQAQYESDKFGWIDIQGETYRAPAIRHYKMALSSGYPCRVVELTATGEFIRVLSNDELWRNS